MSSDAALPMSLFAIVFIAHAATPMKAKMVLAAATDPDNLDEASYPRPSN